MAHSARQSGNVDTSHGPPSALDDIPNRGFPNRSLDASSTEAATNASSEPRSATSLEKQDAPRTPADLPTAQPVLHSDRRGFLSQLAIIPEVVDPQEYGRGTKWVITAIVALAAGTSSLGSGIFYPALAVVADDLDTSPSVVNLSVALYLLAMAITPMWWASWSEVIGRRSTYILSFAMLVIFAVCSALSVDIGMLVVFRILTGGAAAAVQAVGAGTIADIWAPKERGSAMGIFYLGPTVGPGLAPIIGGALAEYLGWRSTLWGLAIFGGVLLILIISCLPETVLRDQKHSKLTGSKGTKILKRFVEPLTTLKLLQHPPIIVTVYSAGLAFAGIYVVMTSIQADFSRSPYNFGALVVGLLYIPPTLGYIVVSKLGGRWIDYLMAREAKRTGRYDDDGKLIFLPEDRMQENIWIAATLYPASIIWYGWVVEYGVHWVVSCVANFFFGIGCMLVMGAVTTMLTEFVPKRSTSGVALNNFVRQILATAATLLVQPLIDAMGTGWMCTSIGLFIWLTGNAAIYALKIRHKHWRVTMERKLSAQK